MPVGMKTTSPLRRPRLRGARIAAVHMAVSRNTVPQRFVPHILETNLDVRMIQIMVSQALLGHAELYTPVPNKRVGTMMSPLIMSTLDLNTGTDKAAKGRPVEAPSLAVPALLGGDSFRGHGADGACGPRPFEGGVSDGDVGDRDPQG